MNEVYCKKIAHKERRNGHKTVYLSLDLHKGRPSYRESLQTSKENIQHFFLFLWVIFTILDPDLNSDSGSGSPDLIKSGSNPDTKH
jgi:hypothetical protein